MRPSVPTTQFSRKRPAGRLLIALLAVLLGGCATYTAKPIDQQSIARNLRVPDNADLAAKAKGLKNSALPPIQINLRDGISPSEAAVIAVITNPALRADRDRQGLAEAQLIQAGILPNPQLSFSRDFVTGGNTVDTQPAFSAGISGEITALLTHHDAVRSARFQRNSVDLDVAWSEWQTAQAARIAVYRVAALKMELSEANSAATLLEKEVRTLRRAVKNHDRSLLDLTAAETSAKDIQLTVLNLKQELAQQRIALSRVLGFPPSQTITLQKTLLPASITPPDESSLAANVAKKRLDLLGLKAGYQSQDAKLRAAIINQFPKISLGFNRASDTTNVHTSGFAVGIDIPLFDRNQGTIAIERATRQQLFDDFSNRVYQAQCDIASATSAIRALNGRIAVASQAVKQLQQLVNVAGTELKSGNIDVISYYQRRYDLIQRRIDLSKLKEQLVENFIALEIASGRYLPIPEKS